MSHPHEIFAEGWVGLLVAAIWGALWGSFFNVLIVRLPCGESLVRPPSHCRTCRASVAWYDNIPILSYLLLRGRCRGCGARYGPRYAAIESLVCLLALTMFIVYVRGAEGAFLLRISRFIITSLMAGLLVAISAIDLETMLVPNAITYPGIPLCVGLSYFMDLSYWWDGAVGAVAGYLLLRGVADVYRLLMGRLGMGYGDAKLLAMLGGLLGWQVILPIVFLSSLQGTLIAVPWLYWLRRRQRRVQSSSPPDLSEPREGSPPTVARDSEASLRRASLPFGPFISLAGIEVMIWRRALLMLFPLEPLLRHFFLGS